MNKKTLILLHGALMNRHVWLDRLHFFQDADLILTPDMAGHGVWQEGWQENHPPDDAAPLTADYLARHVVRHSLEPTKDQWHGSQIYIVGHSLGGLVALHLQHQLRERGERVGGILLGDSPIYLTGDTPSQQAAAEALKQSIVGRNLLHHTFHHFNGNLIRSSKHEDYETALRRAAAQTRITIAIGTRGHHQRNDGSWDCGTFISPKSHQRLRQISADWLTLTTILDAGHFVFHSSQGELFTKKWWQQSNASTAQSSGF